MQPDCPSGCFPAVHIFVYVDTSGHLMITQLLPWRVSDAKNLVSVTAIFVWTRSSRFYTSVRHKALPFMQDFLGNDVLGMISGTKCRA